ncbi:MAG: cobyric acid synthase [Actinomycetota bacterium]|nr:cobyric acid synthase [Actinomycetota bacterium]
MNKNKAKFIMIQGTGSHVGKSVAAAAVCRILKQDGFSVCPFKSQNMALNSYVTASGGEMGRAQAVQAEACGLEPEVYMNPVLIKPVADSRAQIIFMGEVVKNMGAIEYNDKKYFYLGKIKGILNDLKKKFDYIVIEGAGSPAEINLMDNDIVNMPVAEAAGSNVILIGDVDKGGVFASFYGTVKLLPVKYRKYIKGLLVNKFRGDMSLLKPGNDLIAKKLNIPVIGTIPFFRDIYIEEEDSVNIEQEKDKIRISGSSGIAGSEKRIIISVIYLPHISNFTDFNAFELEKGVSLVYTKGREELNKLSPHMIIIPGSKSTINDLKYLRNSGLEKEIIKKYRSGTVVMGICGGFQMLGKNINDRYGSESESAASMRGIGLMDIETDFLKDKNTSQVEFNINRDIFKHPALKDLSGDLASITEGVMKEYEIHMGKTGAVNLNSGKLIPLFKISKRGNKGGDLYDGFLKFDNSNESMVMGTYIHGIFDNPGAREFILKVIKDRNDMLSYNNERESLSYSEFKEKQYDRLADIFRENMDMDLFYGILNNKL